MELMRLLEEVGAVIGDSHIVLKSRRHARTYVNWVMVLMNPRAAWEAAKAMAAYIHARTVGDGEGVSFDVLAAPTNTGDKVSFSLGLALWQLFGIEVLTVFAKEADGEGREFHRGQDVAVKGKRVLVVDDVLTTGGTIRETLEAVRKAGGTPVGVLVACNRSSIHDEFDCLPLYALLDMPMEDWDKGECPVCKEGREFNTTVGHWQEFIDEYGPDSKGWPANQVA
jgi:orotate phosphoribosyltransferase